MSEVSKDQLAYLTALPEWAAFKALAHQIRQDKIMLLLAVKTTEDNMHYQKMMTLKGEITGISELLSKIESIKSAGTSPNRSATQAKINAQDSAERSRKKKASQDEEVEHFN